jgi:hypothetical protein
MTKGEYMKNRAQKLLSVAILAGLALPAGAMATEADLMKRIEDLEAKLKKVESKSLGKWLTVSGDYRFRYDYLSGKVNPYMDGMTIIGGTAQAGLTSADLNAFMNGDMTNAGTFGPILAAATNATEKKVKNESLYTNRFGLNLKAKVTQDVTFTARMLMYKAAGAQDDAALQTGGTTYSFDRSGLFDGTLGHVPGDNKLAVDRVYATWNNIAEQPIWFSIGRRPSTGGVPSHLKQNTEKPGNSGVPALLVDYAFDGVTLGYAPDIDALPGAYAKICYGRGFSTGIEAEGNTSLHNTDMAGVNLVPYETDALRIELQYNHAMNIFSNPIMLTGPFAQTFTSVQTNLGNIDWYGIDFMGKASNLNWFVAGAMSKTDPNGKTLQFQGFGDTGIGLLFDGGQKKSTEGYAIYLGGRYDIESTGTKLGLEYNQGTKNWITFAPASDDMWTAKLGNRGKVYEGYIIQELPLEPISSHLSKAFFKLGYQYYKFDYTGSNSWLGAPVKIADTANTMQLTAPLKNAQDLYVTFEVHF